MALNVLIADDEFFIRQRLKKIIDWDKLDLFYWGEAENGNDVIDIVSSNKIDILLLDIKMPSRSGIDVLEYIYNNEINTKIIFLSGYNDFEYAQMAIKYKAVNYLLKPIDKQSLESALISCRDNLLSELKKKKESETHSRYLRRSFIYKVITGGKTVSELFYEYECFLLYHYFCFLGIFCFDGIDSNIEVLFDKLKYKNIQYEFFQENESAAVVQFFLKNEAERFDIIKLCNSFLEQFQGYIFMSLGDAFPIESLWSKPYVFILDDLTRRYFHQKKQLITKHSDNVFKIDKEYFMSLRQNIVLHLNSKNKTAFEALINEIFEYIKETENPNFLSIIITEILLVYNINSHDSFLPGKNINSFTYELISDGYSLDILKETIKSYGIQCMEHIFTLPSDSVLVKRISDYILQNYTHSDLSVSQISDIFNLNPAYLGNVFKKVMGQSIIQYITMLRMEKAKELLNSKEYKFIQIAEIVGYSDVFYFSKKFKKYYGCSPRNYCNIEEV